MENILGIEKEGKLLKDFAVPSIIAMLVTSLYNLVDQFFIGQAVGPYGNAATNITFPVNIVCLSVALLCGVGAAAAFNLSVGAGDKESAGYYIGNAVTVLIGTGVIVAAVVLIFMNPILLFCGSPEDVLPYARDYAGFLAFGFPAFLMQAGGCHLCRADGAPKIAMITNMSGAIVNVFLDYLMVFVFGWGMKGAAIATIIGQYLGAAIVIFYLVKKFKTVKLEKKHFLISGKYLGRLCALGLAPFFNQVSLMVMQIVSNKIMKKYGAQSIYGEAIPIAVAGVVTKVFQFFFGIIIGISQGMQPIASFNYGAKKYDRAKKVYKLALLASAVVSIFSWSIFMLFPNQILAIFGDGSAEYFAFGVKYMRIYFFFIFLGFIQPVSAQFFTAIGKPYKGIFLSLTRQIIFLIPMLLILPLFLGIDGIMYAGPIADMAAVTCCVIMAVVEMRRPEFAKQK